MSHLLSFVFHAVTDGYFYVGVAVGAAIGGAALVAALKSAEHAVLKAVK